MGGRGIHRIYLVVVDYYVDGWFLRLRIATIIRRGFGGLGVLRRFFYYIRLFLEHASSSDV